MALFIFLCCRSLLEDESEQVKVALARIVGHLSCVQSELSKLCNSDVEASCHSKVLCLRWILAAQHAGNKAPSLKAAIVKPFIALLRPQAASCVKLGN